MPPGAFTAEFLLAALTPPLPWKPFPKTSDTWLKEDLCKLGDDEIVFAAFRRGCGRADGPLFCVEVEPVAGRIEEAHFAHG